MSAGAQASKMIQVRARVFPLVEQGDHTVTLTSSPPPPRQTWVKANYEKAMQFVAFVEVVVVFGRVLFGALLFQNS